MSTENLFFEIAKGIHKEHANQIKTEYESLAERYVNRWLEGRDVRMTTMLYNFGKMPEQKRTRYAIEVEQKILQTISEEKGKVHKEYVKKLKVILTFNIATIITTILTIVNLLTK